MTPGLTQTRSGATRSELVGRITALAAGEPVADTGLIQQLIEAYLRRNLPVRHYIDTLAIDVRDDVARALTVLVDEEPRLAPAADGRSGSRLRSPLPFPIP